MEEADKIVISALREIGCKLGDDFRSFSQVTGTILVEAVATCINVIEGSGNRGISTKMPPGVAKRHKYCSKLGQKMKALGFNGDCDFHKFMYPNLKDARLMLVWCVEKLPKAEDEEEEELGAGDVLNRAMRSSLRRWGSVIYKHDSAKREGHHAVNTAPLDLVESKQTKSAAATRYCVHFMPLFSEQPQSKWDLAASVFELNTAALAKAAAKEAEWSTNESMEQDPQKKKKMVAAAVRSAFAASAPVSAAMKADSADQRTSAQFTSLPAMAEVLKECGGGSAEVLSKVSSMGRPTAAGKVDRGVASSAANRFTNEKMFGTESNEGVDADEVGGAGSSRGAAARAAAAVAGVAGAISAGAVGASGAVGNGALNAAPGDACPAADTAAAATSAAAAKLRVLQLQQDDVAQEEEWEKNLERLQQNLDVAAAAAQEALVARDAAKASTRRINADLMQSLAQTKMLKQAYEVKRRTLEMLPDASNNILKLQRICESNTTNLMQMAAQWEKTRRPLVETYRQLKEAHTRRKQACKEKVKEMKEMRVEMKGMAAELRQKEARLKYLLKEYQKMPKSLDRSMYTSRIMDIIAKVQKQNVLIHSTIEQIHHVQQEINSVGQKLLRTEKLTDHRIFEMAKRTKEPAYVDAYRHLKDIRESYETLVVNVQKIGRLENEMVNTKARIAQLKARNTDANLKQLQTDLAQVKKENDELRRSK